MHRTITFAALVGMFGWPAGCGRPVDALERSEVETLVHRLVEAANDGDIDAWAAPFAAGCPIATSFAGKTKETTLGEYRASLEKALERIAEHRVRLDSLEVERGGRGFRVKAVLHEKTEGIDRRILEGDSRSELEIEKTAGGLRIVSYRTALELTRISDPQWGEVDPRDPRIGWTDPAAR